MCNGCATIINSDDQNVAFTTEPDGATVAIDGVGMGKTPCVIPVPRKGGDKQIMVTRQGYKTVLFTMRNTLDGALAGNILFGGFIGLGIDAISGKGGGYQNAVKLVLEPGEGTITVDAAPAKPTPSETTTSPGVDP